MNLILQQALFENVRAFRNKNDGEVRYLLHNGNNESDWEDVMIIPNLSNEVIDEVLAQPVAIKEQLLEKIEGMSVSVDVSTGDHDFGQRYFGTVTEIMDCPNEKHGVTLLVQDAEPNFTTP